MIFSGDVTFELYDKYSKQKLNELYYNKYYISNKILIEINMDKLSLEQIILEFHAHIYSFFTILYTTDEYRGSYRNRNIPSGENYLYEIDSTYLYYKSIYLPNTRSKNKNPYLTTFYALNCEFLVEIDKNPIQFINGYAQVVKDKNTIGYNYNKYNIKIKNPDISNYNHKMCMLYVSGYEAETDDSREIIIGENINQQIIFEKGLRKIRYLYPHSDINKELVINMNIINKAYYTVNIFVNYKNIKTLNLANDKIIYINNSTITSYCEKTNICPLIIQITLIKEIIKSPKIEISIRKIKNTPTYLKKGVIKKDFICGNNIYYLYTDIGKNDSGEISINFLREYGYLLAKVVKKGQISVDENANWKGIFRMPSLEREDSLGYNGYKKKLIINSEDTKDCIEGCYLLISIQINPLLAKNLEDYYFYPFTILTNIRSNNTDYTKIPKVLIKLDEFIIGNVEISNNEKINEFYEVWLPNDAEKIEFDWQSAVADLYINLGDERPTINNAHFKLYSLGKHSILSLTKAEILQKAKSLKMNITNNNSIKDLNLVIGIWTNKSDSIDTELYSLRIHEVENVTDNFDIIEIKGNQKILCKPSYINQTEYRCLFMITYDDKDVFMNSSLLVYSSQVNNIGFTYIYGNFIEKSIYDEYKIEDLREVVPTNETSSLNSRKNGVNYIYKSNLELNKYLYISIMSNNPNDIMILTSIKTNNYINLNSHSEQLFFNIEQELKFDFPVNNSISVDIVTINDQAELYWENDPKTIFYLRGEGDRISLSSGNNIDKLIVKRKPEQEMNELIDMEDPGLIFYISYHTINNNNNIKEIKYGTSLEINYKDTNLPIYLYSKINQIIYEYSNKYIISSITFKDNPLDENDEYYSSPLIISAQIVKEENIYKMKRNIEISPSINNCVNGTFDTSFKRGQIFLSNDIINSYSLKYNDKPNVLIKIEKRENTEDKIYDKFNIEAQISGAFYDGIFEENIYHYGTIKDKLSSIYHILKVNHKKPYMRIEIAFNSDNLNFTISDFKTTSSNITFLNIKKDKGKIYLTFKTLENKEIYYLNVFTNEKANNDKSLNNYVFKYINAKNENDFIDYSIIEKSDIYYNGKKDGDNYTIECLFNKIDIETKKANITYFFKIVSNNSYNPNEIYDTIAMTESQYYTIYKRNPKDNNGKITLTAKGQFSNWKYINIMAQIQQENNLEYLSYNGVKRSDDEKEEEEKEKEKEKEEEESEDDKNSGKKDDKNNENNSGGFVSKAVYIITIVIFGFIVFILLILLIITCRKKKSEINNNEFNNIGLIQPPMTPKELKEM